MFARAIKRLKLTQGHDAFGVPPFATYAQRRSAERMKRWR